METIILPLLELNELYDRKLLEKVELEMTIEDVEAYDRIGWKYYSDEDFIKYLLPSLGEEMFYGDFADIVVDIKGKRYRVKLQSDYNYPPYEARGKILFLEKTTDSATKGNKKKHDHRGGYLYKLLGQPTWVQNEWFPAHNGKPCYHFMTVENGWGDNGNWNILLAFEDDEPVAAYFEASCC